MSSFEEHASKIRDFAEARDWEKFHTPKNLSMALAGEAGELLAEFQWLTAEESRNLNTEQRDAVRSEIADVAIYLIRLADILKIDISTEIVTKMEINNSRFPETK